MLYPIKPKIPIISPQQSYVGLCNSSFPSLHLSLPHTHTHKYYDIYIYIYIFHGKKSRSMELTHSKDVKKSAHHRDGDGDGGGDGEGDVQELRCGCCGDLQGCGRLILRIAFVERNSGE
ncbi:unnamed protein product [Cuscuta epithymum]|uniref:Uncharacterized protein n=1 Tax=Cuscuta epithymum TaxID=186058 RepID=A0AAV0FBM0_9ASTE|nr:unnamed protein product [Cuscuta epithymum]